MWHDSFVHDMFPSYVICDMTPSYVLWLLHIKPVSENAWLDSFIYLTSECVTGLIDMCHLITGGMTGWYLSRHCGALKCVADWLVCVTLLQCFEVSCRLVGMCHVIQYLQHAIGRCTTLQHTATHCNTLQHATAGYTTLQHNATHCNRVIECLERAVSLRIFEPKFRAKLSCRRSACARKCAHVPVAACCSVLQCVQSVTVCTCPCKIHMCDNDTFACVAVCYSVLQIGACAHVPVAACCNALKCVAACCRCVHVLMSTTHSNTWHASITCVTRLILMDEKNRF